MAERLAAPIVELTSALRDLARSDSSPGALFGRRPLSLLLAGHVIATRHEMYSMFGERNRLTRVRGRPTLSHSGFPEELRKSIDVGDAMAARTEALSPCQRVRSRDVNAVVVSTPSADVSMPRLAQLHQSMYGAAIPSNRRTGHERTVDLQDSMGNCRR